MRNKGTFNFSGNLEVKKDAPLEAGSIVPTYADLTKAETWTDEEGSVWVYKGKNVTCEDRPGKLYQLTSTDYTKTSNWVEIGGGGTGGGIAEAPEDGKLYGRQNATWSEINDYIMIPEGIMFLENTSTSDEILDAFGGLDQFIELTNEIASNNKPLILAANYAGTSQSIVFIFAMCSTNSSSLNRTLNLYSQVGSDLNSILIRYENGQASFTKVIKGLQTTPEVYYFSPTIQSNKVTQDDYTKLQQAITDGKIITVPVGIADLTTTGSRIPVAAYAIDNEISLNFVIDQDSAYPLWVYIRINGSTRDITVTKSVIKQDVYTFIPTISDGKVKQSDFDNLLAAINDHKIIMIDYGLGESQSTGYYIPAMAWYDNSNIIISYNIDVFKYFIGIQSDLLISADSTRIANEDQVLLKNNTDEYTPTNKYNPATKKYVDDLSSGSTIEISDASLLTTNANLSDTAASNWIISIFGNEQSFRNVVSDIISNRTRYWFNVTGVNANVIEMSSVNVYKSQNGTIYELHFIITYYIADTQITKRISIIQTNNSYHVKINDLMQSNNLTTATKISATDYAALDPKDANTMYAVTE